MKLHECYDNDSQIGVSKYPCSYRNFKKTTGNEMQYNNPLIICLKFWQCYIYSSNISEMEKKKLYKYNTVINER